METLLGLNSIAAGTGYRREIARAAITVLEKTKKISPEARRSIMNEIEQNIK